MLSAHTTRCRGIRPILAAAVAAGLVGTLLASPAGQSSPKEPASIADSLTALDPRWTVSFEAPPAAPAGFDAGAAYVPLRNGDLVAVDLDTAAIRWTAAVDARLSPATGEGLVFTGGNGGVQALNGATGEATWRVPVPGGLAAALHYDTGWLIASLEGGDLAAFRASDGTLVWRRALGSTLVAAPAPALDKLYLPLADGRVHAVNLADGSPVWSRTFTGRVSGLLALDDQIIVGTTGNDVESLDLRTGRTRWRWRVGADVVGRASADARHIYFVARDNVVRAVDRRNGNLRWIRPFASRPAGGPLRVGALVLVPFVSAQIATFDALTGEAKTAITVAGELGSAPHLRLGARPTAPRLITVSREGTLQGFAARIEPPPAPLAELPGAKAAP
ncbi:MAG: PQQ-binding-like beta-propeller repeat protein [Acidobacteriota bacterium]